MELLTRQQAEQTWFEPDPNAQFDDLLEALGLYKDISTEYGLNQTVHLISPQNQDQLRLIQHWWWKVQMLS